MGRRILNALIAVGLVVLYLVVVQLCAFGVNRILRLLHFQGSPAQAMAPGPTLVITLAGVVCAVLGTLLIALIRRRSPLDFGLRDRSWLRRCAIGMTAGIAAFALLTGLLVATGGMRLAAGADPPATAAMNGLIWLAAFLCVGIVEEMLIRGVPLTELTAGMNFPIAAAITSSLFGIGHMGNGGEHVLGILNVVLVGVMLAYSVRITGSLWWAIGFHWLWDWMETYVAGAVDSGTPASGRLLTATPAGPEWLSGGTAGPEGSVLCTLVLIVCLAGLIWWARRRPVIASTTGA